MIGLAMVNQDGSILNQLEKTLQTYLYDKAPHLPSNWQEFLVKFLPYLVILGVFLSLPALLAAFGLGAFISPVLMLGGFGSYSLMLVFLAVSVVLEAIAIPGLFNKTAKSWKLLYYAALVNAVYNFLTFNFIGFVVGGIINMYMLFQIKKYYSH
jgi:branched-subunit amino acid transport protein